MQKVRQDGIMLNHKEKRRYVAIMYNENGLYRPFQIHEKIVVRFRELFRNLSIRVGHAETL